MAELTDTKIGELTKDDILDELMNDDDDKTPIDDKSEETIDLSGKSDKEVKIGDGEEEKVDEEGKEKEGEEEEGEIDEEKLDNFDGIPKRQEILKAFPELFKKFPSIETAIYREQQYAELFPTIADAKEASQRLEDFKSFETELFDGDIEGVLKSLKGTSEQAFGKVTSNILQTLAKVDERAYFNTVNHIIKNAVWAAFSSAKENGDEQLEIAAQLLHKFIYNSTSVVKPEEVKKTEPDEKEVKLRQREENFARGQLESAVNDVTTRTDNVIKSTVDKYIDVKKVMTGYVRNKAVGDVMTEVRKSISSDTRFRTNLDKLWQRAQKEGFSESSKLNIRNALISKAKTVLPGIIRKVKNEALEGHVTRTREASEPKDEKPIASGRPASASNTSKGLGKDGKIPKGMKTIDFLMSD